MIRRGLFGNGAALAGGGGITFLPAIGSTTYSRIYANQRIFSSYSISSPILSVRAEADTSFPPATPVDVYPSADGQELNWAAAVTALGSSTLRVWRRYDQTGSGATQDQPTAAKQPIVRIGTNVQYGHQFVTFGWNPTTGVLASTMGLTDTTGTFDRQNSGFYMVTVAAVGGGLGGIFGGLGAATPQALLTASTGSGGNAFALRINTTAQAASVIPDSPYLLPVANRPAIHAFRTQSPTLTKFRAGARTSTRTTALASGAMTGLVTGTDTSNPAFGSYQDEGCTIATATYPSDADDTAITSALNSIYSGLSASVNRFNSLVNSYAVEGNGKVFARNAYRVANATLSQSWDIAPIANPGRTITLQAQQIAEITAKYDASVTHQGYEIPTVANDANNSPFNGQITNGSPTITNVPSPIPPWVTAGAIYNQSYLGVTGNVRFSAGTTVLSANDVAHTVTMSTNAVSSSVGQEMTTLITNGNYAKTVTAVTLAGNAVIVVTDTTNMIVGSPVACANVPTTSTIASIQPGISITMNTGVGITASGAPVNLTTADQSIITAAGSYLWTSVIAPFAAALKAQGANVFVAVSSSPSVVSTFYTVTGVTNAALERFARAQVVLATNAAESAGVAGAGVTLLDDASIIGTVISGGNTLYTTDSVHAGEAVHTGIAAGAIPPPGNSGPRATMLNTVAP